MASQVTTSTTPLASQISTGPNALPSKVANAISSIIVSEPPYQLKGMRLQIEQAKQVCDILLTRKGLALKPYDIKGTINVWNSCDENGTPYTQVATKELITKLAKDLQVDYRTLDGFKEILAHLRVSTLRTYEINENKTKLVGLLDHYSSSPSAPVLELVSNDPEFQAIKEYGITGADFPEAPNNYWRDKKGNPTTFAVEQFARYVQRIVEKYDWQFENPNSIIKLYSLLSNQQEIRTPLNFWGTTVNPAILDGFGGKIIIALQHFIVSSSIWDQKTKNTLIQTLQSDAPNQHPNRKNLK